ncbi:uncharacterized protein LACBIDRAFT_325588 [Laccaria bicolor S238N-H82]|uniref:Predicted protein n=1 Tax=Laccaria bicolor (strain S238N-H82 / ATCC MYA-4686) TaxID=486041 RepID=B0D5J9_LACBS|nr:uncharacterized protein LACBIDRAFT_325588 [Laccaria bicolor S238N-H82]EDR10034.1 predicted protein [Laccaria bicolor S238N-H82]|eukprot:XP_001879419.1 predicted protein [Laccaria bicolor S238N-H82]
MDCLYTNSDGEVPTSGREKMIAGEWIALNASAGTIPSTEVFEQALEDRAFLLPELAARPTSWSWTKQPTWYSDKYHWDAWNVVDCFADENDSVPWFFSGGNSPWESASGEFHFDPDMRAKAEDSLSRLWLCIEAITSNPPFASGTPHPAKFNYLLLSAAWNSARGAATLMSDAKGRALEYLGFVNWWTSSVANWEDPLQQWMIDYIAGFKLRDLKKRGVLLDLSRQWRSLNIGHLLAEDVPVYYFWQDDTDDFPCFTRLSPSILQAYHDTCSSVDRTGVFGEEMLGFQDDIKLIRRYDEFFQLRRTPDHITSPAPSAIPPNAVVYICDFEGWSARRISDPVLVKEYADRYHFCIEVDDRDTYVTIWRWKPRRNDVGGRQRAGILGPGVNIEARRGDREIREVFKSVHAPTGKRQFDEWGRVTLASRLGDVYDDFQGSPMVADPSPAQALLPRPHWVPSSHPALTIPHPTSPMMATASGVQAMLASPSRSGSRASSAAQRSRSSGDQDFRRRSASPQRRHSHLDIAMPSQRAAFVEELRKLADQYSITTKPWVSKKPLTWNTDFLEVGYLLIPDARAQARLRYWAVSARELSTMTTLLLKAVCHGLPFSIGVKVEDFGRFKPEDVSDTDRLVGKPSSAVEAPFAYTAQGALRAYYMSRVNDIIRRPHARILIGLGGPEAWLGRKWGGMELVAQFMDGPSPDVYLHRRGYIDSDDEHPMFLYTDEMTPQEIDILFGCIRNDSERDRSLYPSRDILDEGCFFWTGEWDARMDDMFNDLTKDIQQGSAKFRTPGMWKDYFRRLNRSHRGSKERLNQLVPDMLARLHSRIIDGFPLDWNKRRLAHIELPEEYRPRQIGNRGAL